MSLMQIYDNTNNTINSYNGRVNTQLNTRLLSNKKAESTFIKNKKCEVHYGTKKLDKETTKWLLIIYYFKLKSAF